MLASPPRRDRDRPHHIDSMTTPAETSPVTKSLLNRYGSVLPTSAGLTQDGRLDISGCAVGEVIGDVGTPAMLVDEPGLRAQARRYRAAFGARHSDTSVLFASKALPCPAIAGLLAEEGLGCEVASAGELALALHGGVDPERIVLHGNAKTDADILAALGSGVGLIVIDAVDELDRLTRLVTRPQRVLVRVNPDVRAPTLAAIATGHAGSKFGIPAQDVPAVVSFLRGHELLVLDGLHAHIGSQILSVEPFARAAAALAAHGRFMTYDLGGGLGVRYHPTDPAPPPVEDYAQALVEAVHTHLGAECRLIVEPGRSLVARSVLTAYTVVSVKQTRERLFVAVDGGMGDNLLPRLSETRFAPFVLDSDRQLVTCDIAGPHCESGDILATDVALAGPRVGDVIVVPVTGAYCASLANNYNALPRPPIVFCNEGAHRTVTRRETLGDLLARHAPAGVPTEPRLSADSDDTKESRTR